MMRTALSSWIGAVAGWLLQGLIGVYVILGTVYSIPLLLKYDGAWWVIAPFVPAWLILVWAVGHCQPEAAG